MDDQTHNQDVERILENLLQVMPIFHRKLLRMDLGGVPGDLSRLHLAIMWSLSSGNQTVSALARNSVVTKSQMTHLIDHLVKRRIVERHPDETDRRVINLALTEHGRELLGQMKLNVKESIRARLADLTPEELSAMAGALDTLRHIGRRLKSE